MQTIDLHDTVRLTPADDITLACDDPNLQSPENLAYKAAQLLQQESGHKGGAHIAIEKAYPCRRDLAEAAATPRQLSVASTISGSLA